MRCEQSIVPNAPCFPCLLPSPLAHHPWASQSGASEALPVVPFYSLLVPAVSMASPAPQPPECVYIFHVVSRKRPGVTHVGSQRALILSHTPLKPRGTRLGYAAVWASGPASCLPMLPDRRKVDRTPLASPPCPPLLLPAAPPPPNCVPSLLSWAPPCAMLCQAHGLPV